MVTQPFDWYTFSFPDVTAWLGDVMINLYYLWESFWSPLAYLPSIGVDEWPSWIKGIWDFFLLNAENEPNWLGSLNLIQLAVGSYLIMAVAILIIKVVLQIFTKN